MILNDRRILRRTVLRACTVKISASAYTSVAALKELETTKYKIQDLLRVELSDVSTKPTRQ